VREREKRLTVDDKKGGEEEGVRERKNTIIKHILYF
jgi:hypothetical protein